MHPDERTPPIWIRAMHDGPRPTIHDVAVQQRRLKRWPHQDWWPARFVQFNLYFVRLTLSCERRRPR